MSTQANPRASTPYALPGAMWQEYVEATAAHLHIQLELYMAAASDDGRREAELHGLLILAEARRSAARESVRRHEGSAQTATART